MLTPLLYKKFSNSVSNEKFQTPVSVKENNGINLKMRRPILSNVFAYVPSTTRKLSTYSVMKIKLIVNKNSINLNTSLPIEEDSKMSISIPVYKVYTDIENKSTLPMIKKYLKLKSGIYAFVHNETNKIYVGSSFNLAKRLNEHFNN